MIDAPDGFPSPVRKSCCGELDDPAHRFSPRWQAPREPPRRGPHKGCTGCACMRRRAPPERLAPCPFSRRPLIARILLDPPARAATLGTSCTTSGASIGWTVASFNCSLSDATAAASTELRIASDAHLASSSRTWASHRARSFSSERRFNQNVIDPAVPRHAMAAINPAVQYMNDPSFAAATVKSANGSLESAAPSRRGGSLESRDAGRPPGRSAHQP